MMKTNLPFEIPSTEPNSSSSGSGRMNNRESPGSSLKSSPENGSFHALKQQLLHQQFIEQQFQRSRELIQHQQEKQISQLIQQVDAIRHNSPSSVASSPTNTATASTMSGNPTRDIDQREKLRLKLIKQKSFNDQSAVASPEVKKHLQEFVLQKKRKEASIGNLKSEVPISSSFSHPILRKTASESNLLKMKSKRADVRSGATPYQRVGAHGPTQPVIPEGSAVHDSAPSSPRTGEDSGGGGGSPSSSCSTSQVPPHIHLHHYQHPRAEISARHFLHDRNSSLSVGEETSNNSKSLPNIPSAVGLQALLNKAAGRKSPPNSSLNRPPHSAMLVRRSKSSAILPLRKHLMEKTLAEQQKQQRAIDEEQYYLQQKLAERFIRPTILEEESPLSAMEIDDDHPYGNRNSAAATKGFHLISPLVLGDLTSLSTGLGYDPIMLQHRCTCINDDAHLENPSRISSIWNRLVESGLTSYCKRISRLASLEEIQSCHSENHTLLYGSDAISRESSNSFRPKFSMLECGGLGVDSDTYWNKKHTSEALRTAVGTLIEISDLVVNDELKNGFAIIRPPGHHAEYEEAMGFCYFNSVAITATRLLRSPSVNKIFILDWAIHHGNGTQQFFYENPNVLYMSLHRHDNGNFYPGTGSLIECGAGGGLGFNVNIPWTGDLDPPMGDAEYLAAFRSVVMPIAKEFNPDFVLVSAGFDAAVGHNHPIGGYNVSTACFAYMTLQLRQLAAGKVVLALEGGYETEVLCTASEQCVKALLSLPIEKIREEELARRPNALAVETLQKTLAIQSLYWDCLKQGFESAFLSHLEAWEKEREEGEALSAMASLSMQHNRSPSSSVRHLLQKSSQQASTSAPIPISYT